MVTVLERSPIGNGMPRRTIAQATAALCVGGMVVARAMVDRALADELRGACMEVALKLGGWRNASDLKHGKCRRPRSLRAASLSRGK
jgi:hypothetical protein